jgi:thiol:disulfide interchange protein
MADNKLLEIVLIVLLVWLVFKVCSSNHQSISSVETEGFSCNTPKYWANNTLYPWDSTWDHPKYFYDKDDPSLNPIVPNITNYDAYYSSLVDRTIQDNVNLGGQTHMDGLLQQETVVQTNNVADIKTIEEEENNIITYQVSSESQPAPMETQPVVKSDEKVLYELFGISEPSEPNDNTLNNVEAQLPAPQLEQLPAVQIQEQGQQEQEQLREQQLQEQQLQEQQLQEQSQQVNRPKNSNNRMLYNILIGVVLGLIVCKMEK